MALNSSTLRVIFAQYHDDLAHLVSLHKISSPKKVLEKGKVASCKVASGKVNARLSPCHLQLYNFPTPCIIALGMGIRNHS